LWLTDPPPPGFAAIAGTAKTITKMKATAHTAPCLNVGYIFFIAPSPSFGSFGITISHITLKISHGNTFILQLIFLL
jgi:hypothetical protein